MSYVKEYKSLNKILVSREQRARIQDWLIKTYNCTLVCVTLNIPGPTKDSPLYRRIHNEGVRCLRQALTHKGIMVAKEYYLREDTGPEAYYCIRAEPEELKVLALLIEEEHELGRFLDIDVIGPDGLAIKRKTMGFAARKCMLCGENFQICRRNGIHSIEELTIHIKRKAKLYFKKRKSIAKEKKT